MRYELTDYEWAAIRPMLIGTVAVIEILENSIPPPLPSALARAPHRARLRSEKSRMSADYEDERRLCSGTRRCHCHRNLAQINRAPSFVSARPKARSGRWIVFSIH
jgi:hypothetical protein